MEPSSPPFPDQGIFGTIPTINKFIPFRAHHHHRRLFPCDSGSNHRGGCKMKAIETNYDGYRFRSRLEARWAMFFNTLNIPYEYEKEGYDMDGTWYLPDFWLPKHNYWIEIKGEKPADDDKMKAKLLAKATGKWVIIFYGPIPDPREARVSVPGQCFCRCAVFSPQHGEMWPVGCLHCPQNEMQAWRGYTAARSARFEHDERSRCVM